MQEQETKRVALMIPLAQLSQVDRWRGAQETIPTRSEALRMLVAKGLNTEAAQARAQS